MDVRKVPIHKRFQDPLVWQNWKVGYTASESTQGWRQGEVFLEFDKVVFGIFTEKATYPGIFKQRAYRCRVISRDEELGLIGLYAILGWGGKCGRLGARRGGAASDAGRSHCASLACLCDLFETLSLLFEILSLLSE